MWKGGSSMRLSVRTGFSVVLALACLAILPVVADVSQGGDVVVTKPGVVFHKAGSDDLRGRGLERTVDAAIEAGYSPCPLCFAKELAMARSASPELEGGAATAQFSSSPDSVPAPPVSTVTQPFGLRYASRDATPQRGGVRNPYDDLLVVIPGRAEQGAYGDR
jgi:hypothetical protein